MQQQTKIAIIGGGNLGSAIAEGLLTSGFVLSQNLSITKRNTETLSVFKEKGVQVFSNNVDAVRFAN